MWESTFEEALIRIIRNLEILLDNNDDSISSHVKMKEKGLIFLDEIIRNSPLKEFDKFFTSKNHTDILGYLMHVICRISQADKSRHLRQEALKIMLNLTSRIANLHQLKNKTTTICTLKPLIGCLPGVTCSLFRTIMSDTKLPTEFLVTAVKLLTVVIVTAFSPCSHEPFYLIPANLKIMCDELTARSILLFDYIKNQDSNLADSVKLQVLDYCEAIVCKTHPGYLNRMLIPIVKYIAFMSSHLDDNNNCDREEQIDTLIQSIKTKLSNCEEEVDSLESMALSFIFKLLDELEEDYLHMLPGERETELRVLYGFLRLLPKESLTMLVEIPERKVQLIKVLTQLTTFSTNQPLLFLTENQIDQKSLEVCNSKIYTVEKRFQHISSKEAVVIAQCCSIIGGNTELSCLTDMLKNELRQNSIASSYYIAHLILKGCLLRSDLESSRLTGIMIQLCIDQTFNDYFAINDNLKHHYGNENIDPKDIIKIVISIETIVTLTEIHLRFNFNPATRTIILRTTLCHLLNWASSNSRALSEAALSSLSQISKLYGKDSIKSLIEENIDYIVNGVTQMLEEFIHDREVTSVIAITFKLSSIDSFFYFKDVFERIFKILGIYHNTEKSTSIALLFYRTLTTLYEWKEAKGAQDSDIKENLFPDEGSWKSIVDELSIDKRIKRLEDVKTKMDEIRENQVEHELTNADEDKVIEEIEAGKLPEEAEKGNDTDDKKVDEDKKDKPVEIQIVEEILKHCVNLLSSNYNETKVLALKATACGMKLLKDEEDTLLPLVHQLWSPLVSRLTCDYRSNLEVNLCAFECLVSMAFCSRDFIKSRTLDLIIPKICVFLESQALQSKAKREFDSYCMSIVYKCQLNVLSNLGHLVYHIGLAYTSLWRVIKVTLIYLDNKQLNTLQDAAHKSLIYMMALDADCVWYWTSRDANLKDKLPFHFVYDKNKLRDENTVKADDK